MHEKAAATLTKLCDSRKPGRQSINFIRLVLNTKNVAFDKVIKMDGDMVVLLKSDQIDANNKKESCEKQFDDLMTRRKIWRGRTTSGLLQMTMSPNKFQLWVKKSKFLEKQFLIWTSWSRKPK